MARFWDPQRGQKLSTRVGQQGSHGEVQLRVRQLRGPESDLLKSDLVSFVHVTSRCVVFCFVFELVVKFAACVVVCFGVASLLFWPPPPSPPPFDLETSSRNLAPEGRTAFENKDVAEDSSSIFDETMRFHGDFHVASCFSWSSSY